jgi:hypothetical protein
LFECKYRAKGSLQKLWKLLLISNEFQKIVIISFILMVKIFSDTDIALIREHRYANSRLEKEAWPTPESWLQYQMLKTERGLAKKSSKYFQYHTTVHLFSF